MRRTNAWAIAVAVAGPGIAFFITAVALFGNLFPLLEYRQWIEYPGTFNPLQVLVPEHVLNGPGLTMAFSRTFALWIANDLGKVCDHAIPCHDSFSIGLIALASVFLALTIRRLIPRAPLLLVFLAPAFMLSSFPVLDAVSWQATLLDKLALVFSALALYLGAVIPLSPTVTNLAVSNGSLLIIVFCASNSKEASLSLIFSLFALLFLRMRTEVAGFAAAVRRTALFLFAPLAYAAFHICVVMINRFTMNPAEEARVMGGNPISNYYDYIVYLLNLQPLESALNNYPYATGDVLRDALILSIAIVALLSVIVFRYGRAELRAWWLWGLGSFLLALAIPIRTTGIPPFYLLVPLFYLTFFFFVTVYAMRVRPSIVSAVAGVLIVIHIVNLAQTFGPYQHMRVMSRNFESALGDLARALKPSAPPASLTIYWPSSETRAYLLVGVAGQHTIAPYVMGADVAPAFEAKTLDAKYTGAMPTGQLDPTRLVLGEDLAEREVVVDGKSYPADGQRSP